MYEVGSIAYYHYSYKPVNELQVIGTGYKTLESAYDKITNFGSGFIRDFFIRNMDDPDAEWIVVWEKRPPMFSKG